MKNKFKTPFNRDAASIRDVCTVKFTKPSKVKQSLAYATDINAIYDNFCKTGKLPLNGQQPLYDENYINYDNLIDAQKIVSDAALYFNGLPANIKNQYGNSLEKFVLALNNKDKYLIDNGVLNIVDDSIKSDYTLPQPAATEPIDTAENAD